MKNNIKGQSSVIEIVIIFIISGLLIAMAISACQKVINHHNKSSYSQRIDDGSNYDLQLIFVNDGVKVYKFYDKGRWVYYIDARGSTQSSYSSGKTTYNTQVITVDKSLVEK